MKMPITIFEAVEPDEIVYKRGTVYQKLTGFLAGIYRAQVALYGKAEATERFWWMLNKKEA
jgi:hypothetical protein